MRHANNKNVSWDFQQSIGSFLNRPESKSRTATHITLAHHISKTRQRKGQIQHKFQHEAGIVLIKPSGWPYYLSLLLRSAWQLYYLWDVVPTRNSLLGQKVPSWFFLLFPLRSIQFAVNVFLPGHFKQFSCINVHLIGLVMIAAHMCMDGGYLLLT